MAEFANYVEFVEKTTPTVFRGPYGERLAGFVAGVLVDALADGNVLALKAPWLKLATFPPDAAAPLGRESNLEAYPDETASQYVERIRRRWEDWQLAGHESAIEGQFAAAGYPGARVEFYPGRPGPNGEPYYWSQFWILFPQGTHPVTGPATEYSAFSWGDGTLWGPDGLTLTFVQTIKGIVRKWKPGHWICRGFIFEFEAAEWGGFDYDDGTAWGGSVEIGF